ncbi:type II secretion system protein, partial [Campylobacter coli]
MKKAFTLLELVFVILILGILASLSFSFANQNKNDAKLLKLKIDYEMLNSALSLMRTQTELKQISSFS